MTAQEPDTTTQYILTDWSVLVLPVARSRRLFDSQSATCNRTGGVSLSATVSWRWGIALMHRWLCLSSGDSMLACASSSGVDPRSCLAFPCCATNCMMVWVPVTVIFAWERTGASALASALKVTSTPATFAASCTVRTALLPATPVNVAIGAGNAESVENGRASGGGRLLVLCVAAHQAPPRLPAAAA